MQHVDSFATIKQNSRTTGEKQKKQNRKPMHPNKQKNEKEVSCLFRILRESLFSSENEGDEKATMGRTRR